MSRQTTQNFPRALHALDETLDEIEALDFTEDESYGALIDLRDSAEREFLSDAETIDWAWEVFS